MLVAGVDEAGRGPLAGPVVAGVVVFKKGYKNPAIKDSKQLSRQKREELVECIKSDAAQWAVVAVGPRRIDKINILRASLLAMHLAVRKVKADLLLVDGIFPVDTAMKQRTVVGGDAKHVEISAASILAKVWRDDLMRRLSERYPGYGFEQHAGYATASHRDAIARLGPCPIHRHSFAGVKEYVEEDLQLCIPGFGATVETIAEGDVILSHDAIEPY